MYFGRVLRMNRCVSVMLLGVIFGLVSGCSLYSSDKNLSFADAEGRVPMALFEDMGTARVGKKWLMAQLGKPLQSEPLNANSSLCTWVLTRREHKHVQLLFIYSSNDIRSRREFLHVVFAGDEVLKHWQNQDELVDVDAIFNNREFARIQAQETRSEIQSLIVPRRLEPVTTSIVDPQFHTPI